MAILAARSASVFQDLLLQPTMSEEEEEQQQPATWKTTKNIRNWQLKRAETGSVEKATKDNETGRVALVVLLDPQTNSVSMLLRRSDNGKFDERWENGTETTKENTLWLSFCLLGTLPFRVHLWIVMIWRTVCKHRLWIISIDLDPIGLSKNRIVSALWVPTHG